MQQADAAALVPAHVEHDAAALARHRGQRRVQLGPAVAAQRAEDVAGQALGVHPDQHVLAVADVAEHERDVLAAVVGRGVADRGELAVAQRHPGRRHPLDQALRAAPERDQVGDRDHRQVVLVGEDPQLLGARHARRVLLADDLAQHAGRAAGRPAGPGRRRPRCGPGRRSTPPSLARSGTTWPGRDRSAAVAAGSASSRMVRARSPAEMPVVTPSRASTVTVYAVPRRSWLTRNIGGRSSRSATASVIGTQM